jgi:hypothetical protein
MLARADGVQAFVRRSPAPSPCFSFPTYHIPPTFVFIDIPASFRHFLKLPLSSFRFGGDMLS